MQCGNRVWTFTPIDTTPCNSLMNIETKCRSIKFNQCKISKNLSENPHIMWPYFKLFSENFSQRLYSSTSGSIVLFACKENSHIFCNSPQDAHQVILHKLWDSKSHENIYMCKYGPKERVRGSSIVVRLTLNVQVAWFLHFQVQYNNYYEMNGSTASHAL